MQSKMFLLAGAGVAAFLSFWAHGSATAGAEEVATPAPGPSAKEQNCAALTGRTVTGGSITAAEYYDAGSVVLGGITAGTKASATMCRVRLSLSAGAGSEIAAEVWLPDHWNDKLMGLGGGGFDGALSAAGAGSLNKAAAQGYAVVATDAGHTPAPSVGTWAHRQPERIVDFGHRANHMGAVAAKQVIASFYGVPARSSYFTGCSNGGRDGIVLASRYPEDYDAIVAGAPAIRYTETVTQLIWYSEAAKALGTPENIAAKLSLVHNAILRACDKNDGVEDGLLENPRACRFEPRTLACAGASSDGCLTPGEVGAFERIYGGMRWSDGRKIIAGPALGSEGAPGNWGAWITGPVPALAGQEFYRWLVYDDPDWSVATFDMDRDYRAARERAAPVINAESPGLEAFARRGGKLIIYQGWDDPVITPDTTIEYVEEMQKSLGSKAARQVRLFMVPGMTHCGGGLGATSFDMQAALEAWAERGVTPTRIIATKSDLPESAAPFSRPLCAWPQVARYRGKGSIRDAANFACAPQGSPAP